MPHCETCTGFYSKERQYGCPKCNATEYKYPYCVSCCEFVRTPIKEFDEVTQAPLRNDCPNCGRGPLVCSGAEYMRRLTLPPEVMAQYRGVKTDTLKAKFEEHIKNGADDLCFVKLGRVTTGVRITLKSPLIEAFIKETALAQAKANAKITGKDPNKVTEPVYLKGEVGPFAGHKAYVANINPFRNLGVTFTGWNASYDLPGVANQRGTTAWDFSILLAVGLSEGVSFDYAAVCQGDSIINCGEMLCRATKEFYAQYIRPIDYVAHIVTREEITNVEEAVITR